MKIAPTTNFHYNLTFKSETEIGPEYPVNKKPFQQTDPLDDEDEFFIIKPSEEDDDYDYEPPVITDSFVKGTEF